MPTRPLPPVIGATENALRALLNGVLAESSIGGFHEWVYLNIQEGANDPLRAEELIADSLTQGHDAVAAIRTRLVDAGLLDVDGSLTALGREQLRSCRELVAQITQTLTDGIDPAAAQTTIETLATVRSRAQ